MEKNMGKKINVNAASLVDLKAELFKRKEQFKRERGGSSTTFTSKPVSEKTASIWLKHKHNKVSKGKPLTKAAEVPSLTQEEENQLARSRAALEAKAALYNKLMKKENLPEEEDDVPYLVDFQQKYIDKTHQHNMEADSNMATTHSNDDVAQESSSDNDWVEYTDSFGRTRKCLRKDFAEHKESDHQVISSRDRSPLPDLMSEDMMRDRERQKWEEEALEELSEETGPLHYQDVQHNEIRTHGVAYYQFATDEEKRKEQLAALNKLRDQTIEQRKRREKLKEKRKAIAETRLRKIKARKLGLNEEEVAALEETPSEPSQEVKEEEVDKQEQEVTTKLNEMEATLKRTKHLRPWDRGKIVDPIKRRKQELEDERLPEFAPPASYYKSDRQKSYVESDHLSNDTVNDDLMCDSADVSASSQPSDSHPPFQLPPLFAYPFPPPATAHFFSENVGNEGNMTEQRDPDKSTSSNVTTRQNPDDSSIRESVSEVLRYYKTKFVKTE